MQRFLASRVLPPEQVPSLVLQYSLETGKLLDGVWKQCSGRSSWKGVRGVWAALPGGDPLLALASCLSAFVYV